MKNGYKNFLLLHLIVFIWGFTAILGKLISLTALHLVWFRILIAAAGVYAYAKYSKASLKISTPLLLKFTGIGILIMLHWLCFYGAIKASNVSVTLACFSCGALFTAFVEPLFFKRRIDWREIACGGIAIMAVLLIFKLETQYAWGILLSLLAALGSAFFSVFNGLLVRSAPASVISFYELLFGWLALTCWFFFTGELSPDFFNISGIDWIWLLLLGLVCTAFTFIIAVYIMREISPYTVSLTVNLESVYGIILAWLIFGDSERMSGGFYTGTTIILATVAVNAWLKRK